VLLPVLATAFVGVPAGCAPLTLSEAPAVAKAFVPQVPDTWKLTPDGYGGPAQGTWTYALAAPDPGANCDVTATLKLVQPADRRDGMELGCFAVFRNLRDLGGYEAAVLVRYQGPDQYYRLQVSSLWQELVVWKPSGGVVQVVPYEFKPGETYRLRVSCSGPQLSVAVNDKRVLTWQDTCNPVLSGRLGLARKEGESYFTSVKADSLPAASAKPSPHQPDFREQTWHNLRFYFDGNEPVCTLGNNNVWDLMKFRPGYRPLLYTFNFITDWSRFYPTQIADYKLVESGGRLVIETKGADPKTKSAITQDERMVITYDPARNLYLYDHTCATHVPAEETDKVAPGWDHGDAVFLGGVGSSVIRDPNYDKPTYRWAVFQAPDKQFYKLPFNHNGHYLATEAGNGGPLLPGGVGWFPVDDPVLSPVVRVPELSPNIESLSGGHCWWAYDMHTMFTPKKVDGKLQPGDYVTRVQYAGMEAAEAKAHLAEASFRKPLDTEVKVPLYTAGTGQGLVEPFDTVQLLATPTGAHRIWAGTIDDKVGHGDHSSLRLQGPSEAFTLTGSSYFTGLYGKRARITAWVKTQDVQGEGPVVGFYRMDNSTFQYHITGLTGTHDWTQVSFVTDFPDDCWGVELLWRNSGSGTVWFDDFSVLKLADDAPLDPPVRDYPINPPDKSVVLRWADQGTADTVLDLSGYGHHGKLFGDVTWAEVDGRRVLDLGGKSSYIWPLESPTLNLGPDSTIFFDLKPESGGGLICWGFAFQYSLASAGPQIPVLYQAAGKNVLTPALLTADTWQKLAIVVTKGKLAYYVNGKLMADMEANTFPGNSASVFGTTWHRHLGFFGAGPGDMSLTPDNPYATMKGQVRGVTVYDRTLTEEEIGKL
jgi:hypothetical protein